ncbi:hypothetical protein, partial [Leeuwenhoekiella sp.]|uniref:hypothetical protein n=1 Tax=Leeuwenhoekiella sp. TaxID=1977054 RepID=UPI00257D019D
CSVHFLYSSKENEPKETTPSLRNFLPYQAKTALSAPRRYRSCPSELPTPILNRGSFRFV